MKVHAIQTGTVSIKGRQPSGKGPGPVRATITLMDRAWTAALPIYAWVVEHPEGLIVVDTGESSRVNEPGYLPRWHPYFRLGVRASVAPDEEIGPQLRARGLAPKDVRWVVMTHLHGDHAGGLSHFPGSEILVCRAEFDNAKGFAGKARGFLPHRWPEWFSPRIYEFDESPYGPFPRSRTLTAAGDVTIVPTHGHTKGHVSVVVEDEGESLLLAGDTSYSQALMLDGAIDGITPDVRAAGETLDRIRELSRRRPVVYLPSHDPDARERLERREPVKA